MISFLSQFKCSVKPHVTANNFENNVFLNDYSHMVQNTCFHIKYSKLVSIILGYYIFQIVHFAFLAHAKFRSLT